MTTMSINVQSDDIKQFIRYIIVGVMNTLVTLAVIYVCKSLLDVNMWISNAIGYIAGVINSFMWNKMWVFQSSSTNYRGEALRFAIGFMLCYGLQFLATWLLNSVMGGIEWDIFGLTVISGYGVATLLGMVIYTLANFIYNRVVTFK
ncbi:MAG: GtrA family protein [Duncaniella sp.]|nr:GtrA family protein [Duncaniella sp.]